MNRQSAPDPDEYRRGLWSASHNCRNYKTLMARERQRAGTVGEARDRGIERAAAHAVAMSAAIAGVIASCCNGMGLA